MPEEQSKQNNNTDRVAIISAVKSYLGFFVLVVLVVEVGLGALALKTQGQNQLVALYGMVSVIVILIVIVAFFAYRKPEALLRTVASHPAQGDRPLHDFCNRISGYWWETIQPAETSVISFIEISPDSATATVKMKGNAYSKDGDLAAIWESLASCVNLHERKLFYYWRGWYPLRPNEPFEGFGEISFRESDSIIERGLGVFSDTNLTDMKSTTRKSVECRRSSEQETQLMQEGHSKSIAEFIRKKLA